LHTVLVVDDEALIRIAVADILTDAGIEVCEASGGDQAIQILQSRADIDLLFTDVRMPGMSGVELAKRAAALRPNLKIVLTTGYAGFENTDGYPVIRKPWDMQQILALLDSAGQPN
jgi:CheY-like chemotaxis protein